MAAGRLRDGAPHPTDLPNLRQLKPLPVLAADELVRFRVVEGLGLGVEAQFLAGAPGDVAGVTHHGADVAGVNFLVQRLAFPAAHRVEEVAHVRAVAGVAAAFLHDFACGVEGFPRSVGHEYPAVLAVDGSAFAGAKELRLGPQAHLVLEYRVGIFVGDELRVRPLLVVFEEELAAGATHRVGQRVQSHHVAAVINAMHAVVAEVAGAVVKHPTPRTLNDALVVSPFRRGALPDVVIEARRRLTVGDQFDRPGMFRLPRFAGHHLAQPAALHEFPRLAQPRRAADLRAHLHHALAFASGRHRHATFLDVMTGGFLDIDILAREAAFDGQQRVPMIRRRHHESVHRGVIEQVTIILHQLGHAPGLHFDFRTALFADRVADVADVGDLAVRLRDETVHHRIAAPAHADARDANLAVGIRGGEDGGETEDAHCGSGSFEKGAARTKCGVHGGGHWQRAADLASGRNCSD